LGRARDDEHRIRRLSVTRRALFEELDRPNLNSLPAQPYCFAEWRVRRVGVDYQVELEGHFFISRSADAPSPIARSFFAWSLAHLRTAAVLQPRH
jgi:hypothetical protein